MKTMEEELTTKIITSEQSITELDLANIEANQTITDLDIRVLELEVE